MSRGQRKKHECVEKRVKHAMCKEYGESECVQRKGKSGCVQRTGKYECVQRTGKHLYVQREKLTCVQRTGTLLRSGKEYLCLGPWVATVRPGCVSALGSVSSGKLPDPDTFPLLVKLVSVEGFSNSREDGPKGTISTVKNITEGLIAHEKISNSKSLS